MSGDGFAEVRERDVLALAELIYDIYTEKNVKRMVIDKCQQKMTIFQ